MNNQLTVLLSREIAKILDAPVSWIDKVGRLSQLSGPGADTFEWKNGIRKEELLRLCERIITLHRERVSDQQILGQVRTGVQHYFIEMMEQRGKEPIELGSITTVRREMPEGVIGVLWNGRWWRYSWSPLGSYTGTMTGEAINMLDMLREIGSFSFLGHSLVEERKRILQPSDPYDLDVFLIAESGGWPYIVASWKGCRRKDFNIGSKN